MSDNQGAWPDEGDDGYRGAGQPALNSYDQAGGRSILPTILAWTLAALAIIWVMLSV